MNVQADRLEALVERHRRARREQPGGGADDRAASGRGQSGRPRLHGVIRVNPSSSGCATARCGRIPAGDDRVRDRQPRPGRWPSRLRPDDRRAGGADRYRQDEEMPASPGRPARRRRRPRRRLGGDDADAGQASLHFVSTTGLGALMVPFGGTDRRLSLCVVAAGIPRGKGLPVIYDVATSVVAEGKVMVAKSRAAAGRSPDRQGRQADHRSQRPLRRRRAAAVRRPKARGWRSSPTCSPAR